jgi:uncharacterized membrane protein
LRRDTKIAAAVFLPVPLLILGASALTSIAIANGASTKWRLLFRAMCHGLARRCLTILDVPMPICARCVGIYVGLAAGLLTFLCMPRLRGKALQVAVFVASMPMAIDGFTQAFGLRESTNPLRLATGFIAAFFFGLWALSAVEHREPQPFTSS